MTRYVQLPTKFISAVLALCLAFSVPAPAQSVIVTAVGTDLVFAGAGQPATSAPLGRVSRVTVDLQGRAVFADPNYHLVFRVESDGSISVIAGNNVQGMSSISGYASARTGAGGGYSGDEGPAIKAALNRPEGVAYDEAGNLYIADMFNERIRKVDTQGIITTYAGNGIAGYADSSQALSASFSSPTDVVVDANGNVYVNDSGNALIRKITPQGMVSTIAGRAGVQGNAGENAPAATSPLGDIEAIALDAQGNLYLADFCYNRVRRISGGLISTIAGIVATPSGNACPAGSLGGNGPALSVALNGPGGLAFDRNGDLLISDTASDLVRKLASASGIITIIAGTSQAGFAGDGGSALSATLHNPYGLAVSPGGAIYIADRDNFRIRTINSSGTILTAAGNGRLISSQNGIQPNLATLLDPYGVSFDPSGAMLIADTDNNIIRRMASPNGTLTTIAGTGAAEESGDNGPATLAGLAGPYSVNSDTSGDYYEPDANYGSVRKIGASGSISTIVSNLNKPTQAVADSAGNIWITDLGNSRILRYAPDGSIAQLGDIPNPGGIAADGLGNLYVTEAYVPALGAGQVVRVSPTFAVTTIAGGGLISGTAADGGPATHAQLGNPAGIAVDSAGAVYFSDFAYASVRKVTNGIISTIAGNGHTGFSGDGGPATSASLGEPWGLALDSAGSLYIADVLNNRIRKVLLTLPPTFTVDQPALTFSAASNGKVTSPASLAINSSLSGLLFAVSADQPWLTATPANGSMPASVQVTADPTGLAAGSYTGHVAVTALGANPPEITVTVNFTVKSATPPAITSETYVLNYSFVSGASPVTSQVPVHNSGSGSVTYLVSETMANGSGWLSVSPASGSASANSPGFVTVTITPGQLDPGTYQGTLTITGTTGASSGTVQIPVTVSVTPATPKLLITQQGLTFPAVQGGGAPLPQTFGILNTGTGSMNWTAAVTTASPWLNVSPASGTVVTPFNDVSQVTVTANPLGLAAGTYYGLVSVTAPGNLVQNVTVALNVLSSGSSSSANVYPAGLVFTPPAQGTSPSSQSVSIANLSPQPLTYSSSRLAPGQPWFVQTPASGVIAPNQTATIVVQPDFSNLQMGTSGSLAFQFSDGSHTTVSLLAVIPQTVVTSAVEVPGSTEKPASTCGNPGIVNVTFLNSQPFNVVLGQGSPIQVKLSDNCGLVTGGNGANANAVFDNGDPITFFGVTDPVSGTWTAPWTPTTGSVGTTIQFRITATETDAAKPNEPTFSAKIVGTAVAAPVVAALVQNAASFVPGAISPGGLVTIYGDNLGNKTASQPPPLPTSLGNIQVLLNDTANGTPLPLAFVSDNQVTAQIPSDLPMLNTSYNVMVQIGTSPAAYSVSIPVNASAATPAIFTTNQSGQGQGAILNAAYQLADSSHPVSGGDILQIFCTGLGAVSPEVPTGQAASASPLSYAVNTVTVTIGGMPSQVQFAGLAPNYAGLYQVNAFVPDGLAAGAQPVVITVANQSNPLVVFASPPVTVAVK